METIEQYYQRAGLDGSGWFLVPKFKPARDKRLKNAIINFAHEFGCKDGAIETGLTVYGLARKTKTTEKTMRRIITDLMKVGAATKDAKGRVTMIIGYDGQLLPEGMEPWLNMPISRRAKKAIDAVRCVPINDRLAVSYAASKTNFYVLAMELGGERLGIDWLMANRKWTYEQSKHFMDDQLAHIMQRDPSFKLRLVV